MPLHFIAVSVGVGVVSGWWLMEPMRKEAQERERSKQLQRAASSASSASTARADDAAPGAGKSSGAA